MCFKTFKDANEYYKICSECIRRICEDCSTSYGKDDRGPKKVCISVFFWEEDVGYLSTFKPPAENYIVSCIHFVNSPVLTFGFSANIKVQDSCQYNKTCFFGVSINSLITARSVFINTI